MNLQPGCRTHSQLERLQFPAEHLCRFAGKSVSMSSCFTRYNSESLRKKSCIPTRNRNIKMCKVLRIGQKPAETKII